MGDPISPSKLVKTFSLQSRKQYGEKSWTTWSRKWRSMTTATENSSPSTTTQDDAQSLPLIRVVSPIPLTVPPNQEKHRRSDSWDKRSSTDSDSDVKRRPKFTLGTDSDVKRRPKFTLGTDSDVDLRLPVHGSSSVLATTSTSQSSLTPPSQSSSKASRPRLVRRDANIGPSTSRRWTFAMAMADEEITDEVLVEELEKMRAVRDWTGSSDDVSEFWDFGKELWDSATRNAFSNQGPICDSPSSETLPKIPYTPSLPSFPTPLNNPSANASWQKARRALLTCRECVRTERHYLSGLLVLLAGDTATPPPPLMLRYAGELVKVSQALLAGLEENPSAWGVAAAFLGKEESTEAAFVGWCGVVGGWFDGSADGGAARTMSVKRNGSRPRLSVVDEKEKEGFARTAAVSPLKRSVSVWRRSMPAIPSIVTTNQETPSSCSGSSSSSSPSSSSSGCASTAGSIRSSQASTPDTSPTSSFPGSFLGKKKEKERSSTNLSGNLSVGSVVVGGTPSPKLKRKPTVRDLAILPTQRVMRYVLLFRDLLTHTPSTSPSRALVERAVEAAVRIANKCDRAQDNSAFVYGSQGATVPSSMHRAPIPPVPPIPSMPSIRPRPVPTQPWTTGGIISSMKPSMSGTWTPPKLIGRARSMHRHPPSDRSSFPPSSFFSRAGSSSKAVLDPNTSC